MVGVGIDIVSVDRIASLLARHRKRFLARCFTPAECALARGRGDQEAASLAARWAAKEDFLKALGRPLASIPLREIEVSGGREQAPILQLHGAAKIALDQAGGRAIHLSLSHEKDYAVAIVLVD